MRFKIVSTHVEVNRRAPSRAVKSLIVRSRSWGGGSCSGTTSAGQVIARKPQGNDLEFWKRIKDDKSYAYFIQMGFPKEHPRSAEAMRVVETLEQLENLYLNSKYMGNIRRRTSKYRSVVEKLKK